MLTPPPKFLNRKYRQGIQQEASSPQRKGYHYAKRAKAILDKARLRGEVRIALVQRARPAILEPCGVCDLVGLHGRHCPAYRDRQTIQPFGEVTA